MKVFVSSVAKGFAEYRQAAREALCDVGHGAVLFKDFPAQTENPRGVCLKAVRQSDVFVLAVGKDYGWPTKTDAQRYT